MMNTDPSQLIPHLRKQIASMEELIEAGFETPEEERRAHASIAFWMEEIVRLSIRGPVKPGTFS